MPSVTLSPTSTADDVLAVHGAHVKGKVVLVTGSNTGIGFETARSLAAAGAVVFAAARSQASSEATVAKIKDLAQGSDVHPLELELGSFASVRKAAATFLATQRPLHVLVCNAGIMACPLGFTSDGIETQFGVNHLGHFLLTSLLLDKLKASAPARVVVLSSFGHYIFTDHRGILFDDLGLAGSVAYYNNWERYGNSKLANILFVKELQRRLDAEAADVTCVAVHPGTITDSNLYRHEGLFQLSAVQYLPRMALAAFWNAIYKRRKTVPQGASTTVLCASAPGIVKGEYYADNQLEGANRSEHINNAQMAAKLWQVSEEAVKQH